MFNELLMLLQDLTYDRMKYHSSTYVPYLQKVFHTYLSRSVNQWGTAKYCTHKNSAFFRDVLVCDSMTSTFTLDAMITDHKLWKQHLYEYLSSKCIYYMLLKILKNFVDTSCQSRIRGDKRGCSQRPHCFRGPAKSKSATYAFGKDRSRAVIMRGYRRQLAGPPNPMLI